MTLQRSLFPVGKLPKRHPGRRPPAKGRHERKRRRPGDDLRLLALARHRELDQEMDERVLDPAA
jgi:hypothetical protein